jgi:hypothetical protein
MPHLRLAHATAFAGVLLTATLTESFGQDVPLRYTWMLPKTVVDMTTVYTFQNCEGGIAKVKITATLAARPLPDLRVGQKSIDPSQLQAFSQDRGISLQTIAGSRILSSIGSQPTDQTAQIVGNILGGVSKIVAVALGVPPVSLFALELKSGDAGPPAPQCATGPDSVVAIASQIDSFKADIIKYQTQLENGVVVDDAGHVVMDGAGHPKPLDEAGQKKLTAQIQAAQSLITALQDKLDKLSITIKTTVEPGVTPVVVDTENEAPAPIGNPDGSVDHSGLVAKICPSKNQLKNWFSNLDALFANNRDACTAVPSLEVSVYLDFPNAHSSMFDKTHPGAYTQSIVPDSDQYRDVAYIPVLVWRGERPTSGAHSSDATRSMPLGPPQTLPFGQFGVPQSLPLTVDTFRSLSWAVTFLEDGQITNATFTSKAWGSTATGLFGNAASAANSIATEARNAVSPSNQATALQGQADLIYQQQRLELCLKNPAACPSK